MAAGAHPRRGMLVRGRGAGGALSCSLGGCHSHWRGALHVQVHCYATVLGRYQGKTIQIPANQLYLKEMHKLHLLCDYFILKNRCYQAFKFTSSCLCSFLLLVCTLTRQVRNPPRPGLLAGCPGRAPGLLGRARLGIYAEQRVNISDDTVINTQRK